jgi:signal transduction histidine kinase
MNPEPPRQDRRKDSADWPGQAWQDRRNGGGDWRNQDWHEWRRHWREQREQAQAGFQPPWHGKRRFLFRRFASFLGALFLIFVGGVGVLAYLFTRLFEGNGQAAALVWLTSCGLALAFPILAGTLAVRSFRNFADPLAQVMAAADAVADGDFSVRVLEHSSGEVGRLQRSFNRMAAELQSTDQQRRDLTADVAHELRTPLHIIQGNLEGILDGVYPPSTEQIDLLLEEARRLSRLVEDLRTLSLAEAGKLSLVKEAVDLGELLSEAVASFKGQAEAAGVDLSIQAGSEAEHLVVVGDAGRLQQVLGNLIDNALGHTPAGGSIALRLEAIPGGARLQVSDNGVGIPAEDLPYIFDRFWRGAPLSEAGRHTGSGLGLAIARQLVQAHGGKISVDSQPGQGTTFTIELKTNG